MSDYSQVNETSYYFANSIVSPQTYSNMNNSYSVPQSFQNSAYYKFKYVNGAERGSSDDRTSRANIPTPTKPAKVFKAAVPNKTERQELKIAEGSQGLKFARIAKAIDQIQSDLKCPYTQYFNGEMCVDYPENTQVCPANQYYEPLYNKCMDEDKKLQTPSLNTLIGEIVNLRGSLTNTLGCLSGLEAYNPSTKSCVESTSCVGDNQLLLSTLGGHLLCISRDILNKQGLILLDPETGAHITYEFNGIINQPILTYKVYSSLDSNESVESNSDKLILRVENLKPIINYKNQIVRNLFSNYNNLFFNQFDSNFESYLEAVNASSNVTQSTTTTTTNNTNTNNTNSDMSGGMDNTSSNQQGETSQVNNNVIEYDLNMLSTFSYPRSSYYRR